MERNPLRTASLIDSGFCAWQLSQTPDSLACSPAAAASSWLYWVTIDPPSKNTSSLLSSSLTLSKPMAACSAMNARTASGPVSLGCGPSGPICTGLLSRSKEAARIRGPGVAPAAIWSRRNTSVGTGVSDPAEYTLVNPWSSMIRAFRLAISRCSSGDGMWWKKLTSSGGLNDGSMCPSAEGKVRWQCESTRPGMTVRPGAVDHLVAGQRLGAAADPDRLDRPSRAPPRRPAPAARPSRRRRCR